VSLLPHSPIGEELLDHPDADPAAVRLSLTNIARANALFGGWDAVRWGLARLVPGAGNGPLTLLDVGTGMGDLPRRAVRWARRRGISLTPLGIERHPAAAALAHGHGLVTLIGCGSALPFQARSVDLVLLSQVAHHLAPAALASVARELTRVSRLGVILADLRPSPLAGLGYRLVGPLLRFDHHTITDGVTSLRRGFTPERLARELAAAGLHPSITTRRGVRIVAAWRSDGRPA
jgi:SAM-dependent methyltransferase